MKEVTVKAASLDEALRQGAAQLGLSVDEVGYEIIQEGKKGFLTSREWVVRIFPDALKLVERKAKEIESSKITPSPAGGETREEVSEDHASVGNDDRTGLGPKDGHVAIVDGKVIIANPDPGGKMPIIAPFDSTVEVYVNGEKIRAGKVVKEGDQVQLITVNTVPLLKVEVEITADAMQAFLLVKKQAGYKYRIPDQGPARVLYVKTKVEEITEPDPLDEGYVRSLLQEKGVVYGINLDAISTLQQLPDGEHKILIAEGRPPVPGRDATIEYLFLQKQAEEEKNPYRKGFSNSVEAGTVLAVKAPPTPGENGVDVFGRTIESTPGKDVPLLVGEGVELINNGTVAVAAVDGMPVLKGRKEKYLSVVPLKVVEGDVDIATGNVFFHGNILIKGNVLDGFKVKATGDVEILGSVIRADVYANGNVVVRQNIISSTVQAGGNTIVYEQSLAFFSELKKNIAGLLEVAEILKKQPAFSTRDLEQGEGRLVQMLIDLKFGAIPRLILKLNNFLKKSDEEILPEIYRVMVMLNEKLFGIAPLRIKKLDDLHVLLHNLDQVIDLIESTVTNKKDVICGYAQTSHIKASGNIIIDGRGSVSSQLDAGEEIKIEGKGIVRGGGVRIGKKMTVRELGSGGEAVVKVFMFPDSTLEAERVYPLIIIETQVDKLYIEKPGRMLTVKVDSNGKINASWLKG